MRPSTLEKLTLHAVGRSSFYWPTLSVALGSFGGDYFMSPLFIKHFQHMVTKWLATSPNVNGCESLLRQQLTHPRELSEFV